MKLSNIDTLKVFIISILIAFLISLFTLFIIYSFFSKKFLKLEKEINSLDEEINNTNEKNEKEIEEIDIIEERINSIDDSNKELNKENLLLRVNILKNKANKNKLTLQSLKIKSKENLKIKFSLFNLIILIGSFIFYNYIFSKEYINKQEYPTVMITLSEENKAQHYKLLANLETSILLSDEKLTKLEIIEKSNILNIVVKQKE
ncbi:hypothetical protein O8C94_06260 [Aliarcobacter butzleri]|nr:hypothetical protein [Aliarcobacter butzleri]